MRYQASAIAYFFLTISGTTNAFVPAQQSGRPSLAALRSAVVEETTDVNPKMGYLTNDLISKLRFREVQRELERRQLETSGTLSAMKNRLREATIGTIRLENMEDVREIDGDALDEVSKESSSLYTERHVVHSTEPFTLSFDHDSGICKDRH